jgi:hypothetical protein
MYSDIVVVVMVPLRWIHQHYCFIIDVVYMSCIRAYRTYTCLVILLVANSNVAGLEIAACQWPNCRPNFPDGRRKYIDGRP